MSEGPKESVYFLAKRIYPITRRRKHHMEGKKERRPLSLREGKEKKT